MPKVGDPYLQTKQGERSKQLPGSPKRGVRHLTAIGMERGAQDGEGQKT